MSSRDLVQSYRSAQLTDASNRSSSATYALLIVAGLSVGVAGAMGLRASGIMERIQLPVLTMTPQDLTAGLTEREIAACKATIEKEGKRARSLYGQNAMDVLPIRLPSHRQGVAEAGTMVTCLATTRPEHLCEPAARRALVDATRLYLQRAEALWQLTETNLQMVASGQQMNATLVMQTLGLSQGIVSAFNASLGERLGAIVTAGYLKPGDLGFGMPAAMREGIDAATPGASPCA